MTHVVSLFLYMGSVSLLVLTQNMCDDITETSQVCSSLLGPSGIGVNELRRQLIEINPVTFQGAVPREYTVVSAYMTFFHC